MLAGLAMYAPDILNVPGANHLIQQANALRILALTLEPMKISQKLLPSQSY